MVEKYKLKVNTYRSILAAFQVFETSAEGKVLDDAAAVAILQKMVKTRKESGTIYLEAKRFDLSDVEFAEAQVIEELLPQMLTEQEVTDIVTKYITESGTEPVKKNMGKIVKDTVALACGRTDGKTVSTIVSKLLT